MKSVVYNSCPPVADGVNNLLNMLPLNVRAALERELYGEGNGGFIEEIRLRAGRRVLIVRGGCNILLDASLTDAQMTDIFEKMCGGSVYAHSETIKKGYISMSGGIRVGVCGHATTDGDGIIGIYDISTLCVRIPHRSPEIGEQICTLLCRSGFSSARGVLIYSPPGVGKTTLLRAVARRLSCGAYFNEDGRRALPLRVAVIDTRDELSFGLDGEGLCVDILSGYQKALGIEIAARTLSAQVMICDEIGGDEEEALAIASAQNCGVPLIASAHAASVESLLRRGSIAMLHKAGVFGSYVGIRRISGCAEYSYDIHFAEEL